MKEFELEFRVLDGGWGYSGTWRFRHVNTSEAEMFVHDGLLPYLRRKIEGAVAIYPSKLCEISENRVLLKDYYYGR